MLQKRAIGGRNVEVIFRMPPLDDVVELYLCGDFNGWHTASAPLRMEADGTWSATLILEAGKSYRFRYLDSQGRWHNDWEADAYVPNAFGSEDSVVDLAAPLKNAPQEGPRSPRPRTAGSRTSSAKPTQQKKGATRRKGSGG